MSKKILAKRFGCQTTVHQGTQFNQSLTTDKTNFSSGFESQDNFVSESSRILEFPVSISREKERQKNTFLTLLSLPFSYEQKEPLDMTTAHRQEASLIESLPHEQLSSTTPRRIEHYQQQKLYSVPKERAPSTTDGAESSSEIAQKEKTDHSLILYDCRVSSISRSIILNQKDEVSGSLKREDTDPNLNILSGKEIETKLANIDNNLRVYICQLCKQEFINASCLAQHRCSHLDPVEYRCQKCNKVFKQPVKLASHSRCHRFRKYTETKPVKHFSSKKKVFSAFNTTKLLYGPTEHKIGIKKTRGGEQFECKICWIKFERTTDFINHIQNHNPITETNNTLTETNNSTSFLQYGNVCSSLLLSQRYWSDTQKMYGCPTDFVAPSCWQFPGSLLQTTITRFPATDPKPSCTHNT